MRSINTLRHPLRSTKQYIRDKAISRAQTRILIAGRKPTDFSEDELEVIVKEEEDKLYGKLKEKGLIALAAALGVNLFF